MNPTSESFDQPTQVGTTGGKKLTRKQKSLIYAGLGGVAVLGGGSALAWGMSKDGEANENHPKTEPKPASDAHANVEEPKKTTETPADSTHVTNQHGSAKPSTEPTHSTTQTNETTNTNEPMVATHVTDEMSFDDAFKTARQEVGAGGYFEWNGNLYNTYYKEEWDNLSAKDREEYVATVYGDGTNTDHNASYSSTASYEANKPEIKVGEYNGHIIGLGDADHDGDAEAVVIDGTVGFVDKNNDGILETRVEIDPTTHKVTAQSPMATTYEAPKMSELNESASGSSTTVSTANGQIDVHRVEYQGHDLILGDTNHDGDAEVLVMDETNGFVDADNDGIMETRVELDPTTHQVTGKSAMTEVYHAPSMTAFDARQNQNTATETKPDVEVIKTSVDGHEVALSDTNHDGYVDVMVMDNGIGAVDRDGDHQFETAVQIDVNTGEVLAVAPLEHLHDAPTMDSINTSEHADVAHDYDNNADVSEWVA
jgi:predicted small secreted protein